MTETFTTRSEAETTALARQLASGLGPGATVLLLGDLGSGKTAFVRGLAAGLGIDPHAVSSPTFTLIQEYRGGRLTLHHVDLYRLQPAEVDDLGLEELTDDGSVMAVEWAERLPRPTPGSVRVRLEDAGGESRRITIDSIPSGSSAPLS